MVAQNLVILGVSPECMEHCPNAARAKFEAEQQGVNPVLVVRAVCGVIDAARCTNPGYNFEEAGNGRYCQAPAKTELDETALAVIVRQAQEIQATDSTASRLNNGGINK